MKFKGGECSAQLCSIEGMASQALSVNLQRSGFCGALRARSSNPQLVMVLTRTVTLGHY